MTLNWSTGFELTIPLILAIGLALAWDSWHRPSSPPRLKAYAVRQGWQVDPVAFLDRDLRAGRLTTAVLSVRDQLWVELTGPHKLAPAEVRRRGSLLGPLTDPSVDRACRAVRALEREYQLAAKVEDPRRTDLWSTWRRPVWRERARSRFETTLAEVESLWPGLAGAS